ncbi:sugar ABC transporter permease [Salinibacterium xinjiangense]|uniref:Carbohydrate ABC transporter membrane protein 1, CUT1 family n=1 Tax=Salinibacterium xinjiangense TaxID=386302 RepID=A0A2C8YDN9_9MICO|nr:sugar ABC transporter permease [Salinibacterium xinjiangense]GGK96599.1 sugar ABC transporter permease [Salinibacterium xinjiangense]SOE48454.1 carbohydrate ABC transporter membrane protein 1, CUT1 family [Salinibacterium xinjiangense]
MSADTLTRSNNRRGIRAPLLLLIPSIAILVLGMGYPVIWQIVTSFQQYGLKQQFGQAAPFVGLDNYIALATDPQLWVVVGKSLAFCLITAFVTLGIGTLLALLMSTVTKTARLVLQVALLLAWSMPVVSAMTVWIWLFDRRRGAINYLLDMVPGIEMNRFDWLSTPLTFLLVASIIVVWMSVPFVSFSVYAGLTQVSDEILEAAQLDGATGSQRFWGIILPMIRPVISIVLLLQLIWDLRVFTQIKLLQDAGSKSGDYDLLGTYIYKLGTSAQDFGMASAVSILVLGITIAMSWFYIRSLLKEDAA